MYKEALSSVTMASRYSLGARDKVLAQLLPVLIAESSLMKSFQPSGDFSYSLYKNFESKYSGFLKKITEVDDSVAGTPGSIKFYLAYQGWRVLENWNIVISTLKTDTDKKKALDSVQNKFGSSIDDLISSYKEKIPKGHPLAQLISYQESQ